MKAFLKTAVLLIGLWSHASAQSTISVLWHAERVHCTLREIKPYWAWIIKPADGGNTNSASFKTTVDGIFRSDPTPLINHVCLESVHRSVGMQKEVMDCLKDTVVLRQYPTRHDANGRMYLDETTNPLRVEMRRRVKAAILETSIVKEMDEALRPRGLHIGLVSTEKLCIFSVQGVYHWDGFIWLIIKRADDTANASQAAPFKRNYEGTLNLTPDQERAVLHLVRKIGITNVAEICTIPFLPGRGGGIGVIEADTVINQEARYRLATIWYRPWNPKAVPRKGALVQGDYWIESVSNERRLLFILGTKCYRVRLFEGVSAEQATKLLHTLFEGQFETVEGVKRSDLDPADFNDTMSIESHAGLYLLSCGYKGNLLERLTISLSMTKERLRVVRVANVQIPIP